MKNFPKKFHVKSCATSVLAATLLVSGVSYASSEVKLLVNGNEIQSDVPPQVINGRTMVPARYLAEALEAKVDWDDEDNAVIVTSSGQEKPTSITPSSNIKLIVNGNEIQSDVPPQIINGRTMIPARFLAEALGAEVYWDDANDAVIVTNDPTRKVELTYVETLDKLVGILDQASELTDKYENGQLSNADYFGELKKIVIQLNGFKDQMTKMQSNLPQKFQSVNTKLITCIQDANSAFSDYISASENNDPSKTDEGDKLVEKVNNEATEIVNELKALN